MSLIDGLRRRHSPVETVVKPLRGSEADDGVNHDGCVNRRQAVDYGDDDRVLLAVITADTQWSSY